MSLTSKDLFEILHHEDHKLETIKFGDNYILGCKQCGVDLMSTRDIIEDMQCYKELLKTLRNRNDNLYSTVLNLGKLSLIIKKDDLIEIAGDIMKKVKMDEKRNHHTLHDRTYNIFDMRLKINSFMHNNYNMEYDKLSDIVWGEKLVDFPFERNIEEIIKILEIKYQGYSFYTNDESIIGGCKTFKINYNSRNTRIMVINNSYLNELEAECPTPKEKYKFVDINDYFSKLPDYDDEESENRLFHEFVYRMENDLYDFSNLNMNDVYKEMISFFEGYECIQRYIALLNKFLLNK